MHDYGNWTWEIRDTAGSERTKDGLSQRMLGSISKHHENTGFSLLSQIMNELVEGIDAIEDTHRHKRIHLLYSHTLRLIDKSIQ